MIRGKRYMMEDTKRIYTFIGGKIELENIVELIVSNSGNHKLKTADGMKHVIPPTWIHIEIERAGDWIN